MRARDGVVVLGDDEVRPAGGAEVPPVEGTVRRHGEKWVARRVGVQGARRQEVCEVGEVVFYLDRVVLDEGGGGGSRGAACSSARSLLACFGRVAGGGGVCGGGGGGWPPSAVGFLHLAVEPVGLVAPPWAFGIPERWW